MKPVFKILLVLMVLAGVSSCGMVAAKRYKIDGPYYVEKAPAGDGETLWYDTGNGMGIARVPNVKRVGHTADYIIAENPDGFYFINRKKDSKFLKASDAIGEPKGEKVFTDFLNLKGSGFKFDYDVSK